MSRDHVSNFRKISLDTFQFAFTLSRSVSGDKAFTTRGMSKRNFLFNSCIMWTCYFLYFKTINPLLSFTGTKVFLPLWSFSSNRPYKNLNIATTRDLVVWRTVPMLNTFNLYDYTLNLCPCWSWGFKYFQSHMFEILIIVHETDRSKFWIMNAAKGKGELGPWTNKFLV